MPTVAATEEPGLLPATQPPTDSPPPTAEASADARPEPPGGATCELTPAQQEGPYYVPGAPFRADIAPGLEGTPLRVEGYVVDADCQPLAGAVVDVWQAGADGEYDFSDAYLLRGRVETDETGYYVFQTVLPGQYATGANSFRPAHIHWKAGLPDAAPFTSQLYFEGDEYNAREGVPAALIVLLTEAADGLEARFDIVLATR